jgi:hypothetical protein
MKAQNIKVVQGRRFKPVRVAAAGNKLRLVWKAIANGFAEGARLRLEIESRRGYAHYE